MRSRLGKSCLSANDPEAALGITLLFPETCRKLSRRLSAALGPVADWQLSARETQIAAYFAFAARGMYCGKEEDRAAYRQMLDGLHTTMPDPYDSTIIFPAIVMGHSELVMKAYSECIHPANMFGLMSLWIDMDPINRTIRHPDFMDFAKRIGMVEAWDRFGWPDLIPADPRSA